MTPNNLLLLAWGVSPNTSLGAPYLWWYSSTTLLYIDPSVTPTFSKYMGFDIRFLDWKEQKFPCVCQKSLWCRPSWMKLTNGERWLTKKLQNLRQNKPKTKTKTLSYLCLDSWFYYDSTLINEGLAFIVLPSIYKTSHNWKTGRA